MPDEITLRSPRPDEMHAFMRPMYDAFGERRSPSASGVPGALERADALFTPPRSPWNATPF